MRLHLACIGKLKSGPERALVEDYRERVSVAGRQLGFTAFAVHEHAESRKSTIDLRNAEEAQDLWKHADASATTIAFDERGKDLSSAEFAGLIQNAASQQMKTIVFMIGGPDGHSPDTRTRANHVVALGKLTWPHRLVRIMIMEQIYRAFTILSGHPYHRS